MKQVVHEWPINKLIKVWQMRTIFTSWDFFERRRLLLFVTACYCPTPAEFIPYAGIRYNVTDWGHLFPTQYSLFFRIIIAQNS